MRYNSQIIEWAKRQRNEMEHLEFKHLSSFTKWYAWGNLIGIPTLLLPAIQSTVNTILQVTVSDDVCSGDQTLMIYNASFSFVVFGFNAMYSWWDFGRRDKEQKDSADEYRMLIDYIDTKLSLPDGEKPDPQEFLSKIKFTRSEINKHGGNSHAYHFPCPCGKKPTTPTFDINPDEVWCEDDEYTSDNDESEV